MEGISGGDGGNYIKIKLHASSSALVKSGLAGKFRFFFNTKACPVTSSTFVIVILYLFKAFKYTSW